MKRSSLAVLCAAAAGTLVLVQMILADAADAEGPQGPRDTGSSRR